MESVPKDDDFKPDRRKSESEAAASASSTSEKENSKSSAPENNPFECNICLESAKDPVVSFCGHLFCWPCIHQWMETKPNNPVCPVCKSEINKEKVVPLYGRGGEQSDPREKPVPPRPQGQRTEPRTFSNFFGFGNNNVDGERQPGGLQFSFGVGAFPFTFFGTSFNLGQHGQPQRPRNGQDDELSQLFLIIAVLFIIWLFVL